ncbi:MAG: 2-oxo acid dehydrogenase subunit E2 [Steroidobacteraceae bacterium]|nr:2-oxo acid dehydrogenase subunit E2 [Steroidobacteraceae bacterium]
MTTFHLPDLGEGLAEAEIIEWRVQVGDRVSVDQPMVALETAKAVVDVPAPFAGTVTALHGAPGDVIATGAPLIDFDAGTLVGTMPATGGEELLEPSPRDTHEARRAPAAPAAPSARAAAAPAARALAKRLSIDLRTLAGSGRGGLITIEDVLGAMRTTKPAAAVAAQAAPPVRQPLRGARRTMHQTMTTARDQIALSTVCDDADVEDWQEPGNYMPRLVRAMVRGAQAEPGLNAWFDADEDSRALHAHIDLAVAVDTPDGLVVPVIRDVAGKSPQQLAAALDASKQAARARRLTPQDLRGFTLMLSNFGSLAGRYATPQVVPPAVAILGVGRLRREAVVLDDAIVARRRLPLSLSFDHRCVTGGEACRFLAAAIADLQKPE